MFVVEAHVKLTSVTKRKSFITLIIGIDVIVLSSFTLTKARPTNKLERLFMAKIVQARKAPKH
jgi:hypothetical protein